MGKLAMTKAVALEVARWAFEVSGGMIEPPEEHVHPDGDGGPSWWSGCGDVEYGGNHRHWNAVAFYGEAGLEFAARRGLSGDLVTHRVCEILDHVAASTRPSVRRAAADGATFGTSMEKQPQRLRIA